MRARTWLLALLWIPLAASQAAAQCEGEIFIDAPVCGTNFIDQPSVLLQGRLRSAVGTVRLQLSTQIEPIRIAVTGSSFPCTENAFSVTIPLTCGCTSISASLEENPNVALRRPMFIRQGPPTAWVTLPGRVLRVRGCSDVQESLCAGTTCGSGPGAPPPNPSTACDGGPQTCYATSTVTITGYVPTSSTTLSVLGPMNTVDAVVDPTPVRAPGDVLAFAFTAPAVQLADGPNGVTFRHQTGSVTVSRTETVCVQLLAPPRVCLTFSAPADSTTVTTATTTVVGRVDPRDAIVRLTRGMTSVAMTPDTTGRFAQTVTLQPGPNALQLEAEKGATRVTVTHQVTYQAPQTSLFVTILQPKAGTTVPIGQTTVLGQTLPGASVRVESGSVSTTVSPMMDGTWGAPFTFVTTGEQRLTATASLGAESATSSISFTVAASMQPPLFMLVHPALARVGSHVDVAVSLREPPRTEYAVTVGGRPAALIMARGLAHRHRRVLDGTEVEGATTAAVRVDGVTDSLPLTTDFTPPPIAEVSVAPVRGTTGTTVSVAFTLEETPAGQPWVTIGGANTRLTSVSGLTYSFERTLATTSGSAVFIGSEPIPPITTAAIAASDRGRVALATGGQVRVFEATDPAIRRPIAQVPPPGDTVDRVYLEGNRVIVAFRDRSLLGSLESIGGVDASSAPPGHVLFNVSRLTGLNQPNLVGVTQLETTWQLSLLTYHHQVEIQGELLVSLDEDPSLHTWSINAGSLRAFYNSFFQEDQYRTPIPTATHIALERSPATTLPMLYVVAPPRLIAYRLGYRFGEHYRLTSTAEVSPSAGIADRVFCGERVAVLTRTDGGVDFLDLTDPEHPVRRGTIQLPSRVVGASFDRQRVVLALEQALVTVDTSSLDTPSVIGSLVLDRTIDGLTAERPIVTTHRASGHSFFELPLADAEGRLDVRISARDRAGNVALDATRAVTADFTPPRLSSVQVAPDPASRGTTLAIDVVASEELQAAPAVLVAGRAATLVSTGAVAYRFSRTVDAQDVEGSAEIEVRMRDLVGLEGIDRTGRVTFDFTPPSFESVSIQPQFAGRGTTVTISFSVSEAVRSTPAVAIGGRAAELVSQAGLAYTFRRILGEDEAEGEVPVVAEATDRAGNRAEATIGTVTIDVTPPVVSDRTIAPTAGTTGTSVAVGFSVNETLGTTPVVTLGGRPMTLTTASAGRYELMRELDGSETEGQGSVRIAVEDRAGNRTVDSELTFRVDFTPPAVASATVSPDRVRAGAPVTLALSVSEALATTPVVTVAGGSFALAGRDGLSYTFVGSLDGSGGDGFRPFRVALRDIAGNVAEVESASVIADFTPPSFLDVTATPALASRSTTVAFEFRSSEALAEDPTLSVGGKPARFVSVDGSQHRFERGLDGSEGEGTPEVEIAGVDLAGNPGTGRFTPLRTDFTPPAAANVSAAPSPATTGTTVTVTFMVDDTLPQNPAVTIGDQPAAFKTKSESAYIYTRKIDGSEGSGTRPISISLIDEAGNPGTGTGSIVLDFAAPVASLVSVDPSTARHGKTVTIKIDVDEPVQPTPVLTVGGREAAFVGVSGHRYSYTHVVQTGDPGSPAIVFTAQDPAGNRSTTTFTGLTTDFVKPVLTVSVAPSHAKHGTTVTAHITSDEALAAAPGVSFGEISMSLSSTSGNAYVFTHTVQQGEPQGSITVHVKAHDPAGNETTDDSHSVTVDFVPPAIESLSSSPDYVRANEPVAISFSVQDTLRSTPVVKIGDLSAALKSRSGSQYSFERVALPDDGEGRRTISVSVEDLSGNTSEDQTRSVTFDFTLPALENVSIAPSHLKAGTTLTVSFDASERLRTTPEVKIDSHLLDLVSVADNKYVFSRETRGTDTQGTRPVSFRLVDPAGNELSDASRTVVVDFAKPALAVDVSPAYAKHGTQITANVSSNETLATTPTVRFGDIPMSLSSISGNSYAFTHTAHRDDPSGVIVLHVRAEDPAGNEATDDTRSVTVDFAEPSIANLVATPAYVKAGADVTVSFSTDESLVTTPNVKIGSHSATLASRAGNSYSFSLRAHEDHGDGAKVVYVSVEDHSGNTAEDTTRSVTFDFTPPGMDDVSVAPSHLKVGTTLAVSFTANETLRTTPEVSVDTHPLNLKQVDRLRYFFERRTESTDNQGTKPVTFRIFDLAGNESADASRSVVVDFDAPAFDQISVSPSLASTGTTVTVQFHLSETVPDQAIVTIGGQAADFTSNAELVYTFARRIDGSEGEGDLVVRLEARDRAGNVGSDDSARLITDFRAPRFSSLSASPTPATTGTTVTLSFDTDEPLRSTPSLTVGGHQATFVELVDQTYRFRRTITGDEGEGTPEVEVRGVDRAGNAASLTGTPLVLDFRAPRIQGLSVSPIQATTGTTVTVTFSVDEALRTTPAVAINGRSFAVAEVQTNNYRFTRVIDGSEGAGARQVVVSATDLAGNEARASVSIDLDFVAPLLTFRDVAPAYATRLTTVTARVDSDEALGAPPEVKLGNRAFDLAEENGQSYRFVLTLDGSEGQGASILVATGRDPAGNEARTTTAGPTIDFVPPIISNGSAAPSLGREGTTITIQFDVNESLTTTPTVRIADSAAKFVSLTAGHYTFTRRLDKSEPEATNTVTVIATDRAGNSREASIGTVRADFTSPSANSISIDPASARTGTVVTVAFAESETLATTPVVRIGSESASLASVTSGVYRFERKLNGTEGQDDVEVSIRLEDEAGNTESVSAGAVHVDFVHPQTNDASVSPTIATTGTSIEARFTASETLATAPVVSLGDLQFSLEDQVGLTYAFSATVTGQEQETTLPVRALLTDSIGNETTSTLGSVRLDFTAPRFAPVSVSPSIAASGTAVNISLTASEALTGVPSVAVGNQPAELKDSSDQSYVFRRIIDGSEGEGAIVIRVSGTDLAGITGEDRSALITTDFTPPRPGNVRVVPSAGRVGTEIVLSFTTTEAVTGTPRVFVSDQPFVAIGTQDGRLAFNRALNGDEGAGDRPTRIELVDLAGNSSVTTGPALRTDFTTPTAEISVAPSLGKAGTTVEIQVLADEALAAPPAVKLGGEAATLITSNASTYRYSKELSGTEPHGIVNVEAKFADLVGNPGTATTTFETDFRPPEFLDVKVSQGPFGVGASLIVTFTVSETLISTPTLGPGQFEAIDQQGNTYTFFRMVLGEEGEGTIPIIMHAEDLAGNETTDASHSYVTDFSPPEAKNVSVAPSLATIGTTTVVRFEASDDLVGDPLVAVAGQPASLLTSDGLKYAFEYTIQGHEAEGENPVEIQLFDLAGNLGTDQSARVTIDYTPPDARITPRVVPGKEGAKLTFDSRASTDVSGITSTVWRFSGGGSSTAPVAEHTFVDGPTTQTIELTVTDAVGLTARTTYSMPVLNVSPTVALDATSQMMSGIATITWRTQEPGTLDVPTVGIVARDLKLEMQSLLITNVPDGQRFEWDTTASKESMFQLFVTVRDKDGGEGTASSGPIIVNNRPLGISTGGAQPRYFNPKFGEPTALTYTLSEHAYVTVKLLRSKDASVVATLAVNEPRTEGSFAQSWNGMGPTTGQLLPDGEYGYIVEGVDLLGNRVSKSSLDSKSTIVLDTTRPAPPAFVGLPAITNRRQLTVEGTKDQGSGIRISRNGSLVVDAAPDDSSTWVADVELAEGPNQLTAYAKDRAGNVSDPTTAAITLDTIAPSAPVIASEVPATTQLDQLTISGTKDANTALIVNGVKRTLAPDTTWSEQFTLRAGNNPFEFQSIDTAENRSPLTAAATFRTPNIISAPLVPGPLITNSTSVILKGTKQASSDLTIKNLDNGSAVSIPVSAATSWSISIGVPHEEVNSFTAQSADSIGSQSPTTPFTILRDTQGPAISLLPGLTNTVTSATSLMIGIMYSDQPKQPETQGPHTLSGINVSSAKIFLDGLDVTAQSTVTSAGITTPRSGLAAGLHSVSGMVSDIAGNSATVSGSFYVVPSDDGLAPVVTLVELSGALFSPAYNPYEPDHEAKARLGFTTNVPVTGTLTVTTPDGKTVRTMSVPMSLPSTVNYATWDGKDNEGDLVRDGYYTMTFRAENFYKKPTTTPSQIVQIHY